MADRIADVEVYLDAVRRPLKYDERLYAGRDSTPVAVAQRTLATGSERAAQLMSGQSPWMTESGVRGFYSRIDGSAQPYILTMPEGYDAGAKRQYRLDIFMHGRDDTVLEQQFMAKSTTGYASKPFGPGADRFMLQPYGRYTNASRFAGEVDGLEAIESVARAYPIDRDRMVMAGFSMGGASAWSYTVHYADRWAAAAPGAGFTETRVFLRGDLARQPQNAVQQTLWHLYDATDYALNTFNVPVVAYSGANDGQKQAADAMAAAMLDEGLTLEHVIGPNTGHSYEPGARQQLQDRLDQFAAKGRNPVPREVRFTTWTLKYNKMYWVTVDAMNAHWERARVTAAIDGDAIRATTAGVSALHLVFDPGLAPFAAGARPTRDHRRHHADAARRRARQVAQGGPGANSLGLEGRRTARSGPPEDPRAAGADRRCVHGGVRVRAADRASPCPNRSGRGRASRPTTPSASGFTSSAASRG